MATVKRTVLGIEIGPREVRMVEMRGGQQPHILKAAAVPLPAGAMDGDRVVQVEAVAEILRGLHSRLGCQSRSAVVGMGVQSVVTRILAIPKVPDSELRVVIEGELAHYQILRAGTGAFDFFRLETPATSDVQPSVLLMAIDDRTAQGYRQAVEKAGLQLLALEPVTLALYRTAFPMLDLEPAALCLAVTPQRSELSILDHGQIRLYRRLDLGSDDLIQGRKAPASSLPGRPFDLTGGTDTVLDFPSSPAANRTLLNIEKEELSGEDDDTAELDPGPQGTTGSSYVPPRGGSSAVIIPQAAAALANEVQRSLDYYRREFPDATTIGRIILATNDPGVEALSGWIAQTLRMDVRVVEPPTDPTLPRQTAAQLEAPQGLRFLGAVGLALHALTPDWKRVPHFNLATGTSAAARPVERDQLAVAMLVSIGLLLGGLYFGITWNRSAQHDSQQVARQRQILGLKQQERQARLQEIRDEQTLAGIIRSNELPIPRILDLLTDQMPPDVGLTKIEVQRNGHILVEGDARELQSFNTYYLGLITCPKFVSPRYQSLATDPVTRITHFKVETSLKGTQDAAGKSSTL